jgi:hypothetical protein
MKNISLLTIFILLITFGCSSQEDFSEFQSEPDGANEISHEQITTLREFLASTEPRKQVIALAILKRFPSLIKMNTERVESLKSSSPSEPVKEKAAEVLALKSSEEPE